MTATALPAAATRAARLLVATHLCVDCRALPIRPFDPADVQARVEYRPNAPRPAPHGGPRSRRCTTHHRAKTRSGAVTRRAKDKERRRGVPVALQQVLWEFQGCACPCGRKRAPEVPAGVTLDHDHSQPCVGRDHPEEFGCLRCTTGYLCQHCNREVVGWIEKACRNDRAAVVAALTRLRDHVADPPLAQLLAERPELLEESAA